jgi:hypothetical protein
MLDTSLIPLLAHSSLPLLEPHCSVFPVLISVKNDCRDLLDQSVLAPSSTTPNSRRVSGEFSASSALFQLLYRRTLYLLALPSSVSSTMDARPSARSSYFPMSWNHLPVCEQALISPKGSKKLPWQNAKPPANPGQHESAVGSAKT